MSTNRTKIIATLGPATSSKQKLIELISAGVNVCRINFSHGTHEEYKEIIGLIREINEENNKNVAIIGDLQGPKIRIGELAEDSVELIDGAEIIISTTAVKGDAKKISVSYQDFVNDVKPGDIILLDDGKLSLQVKKGISSTEVLCEIVSGGMLKPKKGVNLPNSVLSIPSLTLKDKTDLDFALEHKLEWIALSFVRSARDIIDLKHIIAQGQGSD